MAQPSSKTRFGIPTPLMMTAAVVCGFGTHQYWLHHPSAIRFANRASANSNSQMDRQEPQQPLIVPRMTQRSNRRDTKPSRRASPRSLQRLAAAQPPAPARLDRRPVSPPVRPGVGRPNGVAAVTHMQPVARAVATPKPSRPPAPSVPRPLVAKIQAPPAHLTSAPAPSKDAWFANANAQGNRCYPAEVRYVHTYTVMPPTVRPPCCHHLVVCY